MIDTTRQRTRLAWRRTSLSAAVIALLLLADSARGASVAAGAAITLAALLCWFALVLIAYRRIQTMNAGPPSVMIRSPVAVGILVLGYALIGIVAIVIHF